ncbi:MAG TPA: hypothetical protein VN085_02675 [Vicinamibacterales bacterium]|nr:hypothetical protein [Vicinamibacterales bacterium]
MFEHPDEWQRARRLISVFNFTQQHTGVIPDAIVGPNRYDALVAADVFAKLKTWGIRTSLGVGSVKTFYCHPGGMEQSVRDTLNAVQAVIAAGGEVSYLPMDEPFLSGSLPECDGPGAMDRTADRLASYMKAVHAVYPSTQIGLIEAYPSFTPTDFRLMLNLMDARGIRPAFLQVDVDIRAVRPPQNDLVVDLKSLREAARARKIPFGVIVWGYNGDADALFAFDASHLAHAFESAFPNRASLPDQVIFASWSESATGLRITPSNLPDSRRYTLTNIMMTTYRRLIGENGFTDALAVNR